MSNARSNLVILTRSNFAIYKKSLDVKGRLKIAAQSTGLPKEIIAIRKTGAPRAVYCLARTPAERRAMTMTMTRERLHVFVSVP